MRETTEVANSLYQLLATAGCDPCPRMSIWGKDLGMKGNVMTDASSIHRELLEAVEAHDFDRLRSLYHPDYTYTGPDGIEQPGAEAGVAICQTYTNAFPDLSFEVRRQWFPGKDSSIIELVARGTHKAELDGVPATGKQVEVSGSNIIEVREGKIYREREYYDALLMMRQLGVAPESSIH